MVTFSDHFAAVSIPQRAIRPHTAKSPVENTSAAPASVNDAHPAT